ncbi:hypothetical protein Psi02_72600 [Planotetraspora silvatica]|uniref:Uncharacterized protein n=2 Tax=Planotetraspora silvatica TaxID=234614 RepID=A0A8J3UWN1_9ACTN|nr:hypothetical protein Psi02_72600 [Planotetraspora silvatica]
MFSRAGGERDVLLAVADAISGIEYVAGTPSAGGIPSMPKRADLAGLLLEVGTLLEDSLSRLDVNSVAACTERVFETFFLFDDQYGQQVGSRLAKLEDHAWWRDVRLLNDRGDGALAATAMEAMSCAEIVYSTCIEADLRGQ